MGLFHFHRTDDDDVFLFCLLTLPDIFTLQSHFLRQSGHSEKAVSLFQAMIDFTFFKPDSVQKLTTKQQVNALTMKPRQNYSVRFLFFNFNIAVCINLTCRLKVLTHL